MHEEACCVLTQLIFSIIVGNIFYAFKNIVLKKPTYILSLERVHRLHELTKGRWYKKRLLPALIANP